MSRLIQLAVAAILFIAILIVAPPVAAIGWRVAFLTVGGPAIGAVVMLAIAALTGARWRGFAPLAGAAPVIAIAAIGIGVIQLAVPPPSHLGVWQQPIAVGLRAVVAAGALAWMGNRIAHGASTTFAAIALSIYALLVTVIGSDWMLGGDPGHAVSSIGMILFVEQIGGACAVVLVFGWGDARFLNDMGKLLVASALGLSYLAFMDYLILWYGDVPSKIDWYVARSSLGMEWLAGAALLLGLAGPIAAQALIGGPGGQRTAGLSALAGLLLFNLWWCGGGPLALVAACVAGWLIAGAAMLAQQRSRAHG